MEPWVPACIGAAIEGDRCVRVRVGVRLRRGVDRPVRVGSRAICPRVIGGKGGRITGIDGIERNAMNGSTSALLALAAGAASIGALHSLAPDHWVPFAALARARGWSTWRTARITALCGLGHVTVSAALGLLALWFGLETLELFGERLEAVAGILLIAFGVAYGVAPASADPSPQERVSWITSLDLSGVRPGA